MKRYESGQTLVEVILALAVVIALVSGITLAITSSLKNATFTKNQNLATFYAQQGMEIVRGIKDRNWTFFNSFVDTNPSRHYSLSENSAKLDVNPGTGLPWTDGCPEACTLNIGGIFSRRVKIDTVSLDCDRDGNGPGTVRDTKVTVQVKWADRVCNRPERPFCHQVELVSCFAKINTVPTP